MAALVKNWIEEAVLFLVSIEPYVVLGKRFLFRRIFTRSVACAVEILKDNANWEEYYHE